MTVIAEHAVAQKAQGVSEKTRSLLSKLNLYYAGVALVALVNLYLLVQIAFSWSASHSRNEAALGEQRIALKTAEIATKPLEGLDGKLTKATDQADAFYQKRLPYAYSQVAGELGALAKRENVKLTRVQYAESPVLENSNGAVTEVRMDASLSGDYKPLVMFVNSLERDKMFFLINGVTLTGQQSGTVGLRLRLTTYLRAPQGKEVSDKNAAASDDATAKGSVPR
jgi:type IV pilus assembly protein PilO